MVVASTSVPSVATLAFSPACLPATTLGSVSLAHNSCAGRLAGLSGLCRAIILVSADSPGCRAHAPLCGGISSNCLQPSSTANAPVVATKHVTCGYGHWGEEEDDGDDRDGQVSLEAGDGGQGHLLLLLPLLMLLGPQGPQDEGRQQPEAKRPRRRSSTDAAAAMATTATATRSKRTSVHNA